MIVAPKDIGNGGGRVSLDDGIKQIGWVDTVPFKKTCTLGRIKIFFFTLFWKSTFFDFNEYRVYRSL